MIAALIDIVFGPLGLIALLGGLGMALILFAVPLFVQANRDPFAQLKVRLQAPIDPGARTARLRRARASKLERYRNFLEPQNPEELTAMRLELVRAGYPARSAVQVFFFVQLVASLMLLSVGLVASFVFSAAGDPPLYQVILWVILPGLAGYMGPRVWLRMKQDTRRDAISAGFPDALDLLLVCVEAGQSLDQSIARVALELQAGHPILAEEFEMVSYEIRAGKPKEHVLKEMADRVDVNEIHSFVTVLNQSQNFGTPITDALRVYAGEMRDKRVQRAEEKANTMPTKMSLATMLLTTPPVLLILIGPSIYRVYQTLVQGVF
ncbi:MAG: type II secretion system F family protein [Pseudomonadota bacterium]